MGVEIIRDQRPGRKPWLLRFQSKHVVVEAWLSQEEAQSFASIIQAEGSRGAP